MPNSHLRNLFSLSITLVVLTVCAEHGAAQTKSVATVAKRSTATQRAEIGITVYNQNFGLVREVRNVDLGTGKVALEFRDVAAQIQPETVHIQSASGKLRVLEQNYRYDLLSPQKLLEKYVGAHVKVYRWNEKTGREEAFDAEVLSVVDGPVLKINGEITFNFPGRLGFPQVPANLISKPTLVWLLESSEAKQKVEVNYLTHGLNWQSDYVLTLSQDEKLGQLIGWVTLHNQSGAAYTNARLKLVAGDVQRVQAHGMDYAPAMRAMAKEESARGGGFREEVFFEYHLYTLERPTNLLENEQKQVLLLSAQNIPVRKNLVFQGSSYYYRSQYGNVSQNQKVGVFLEFENKEKNRLGMPLPKGTVRVYKADSSAAKQFVGEDAIEHTPRDEKVRIKMGEAFDVVADRKQLDYKVLGTCSSESSWEVELRNHKDQPVEVEVLEPVGGDWEVVNSNVAPVRKDVNNLSFMVKVPKRGKFVLKYRLRLRSC